MVNIGPRTAALAGSTQPPQPEEGELQGGRHQSRIPTPEETMLRTAYGHTLQNKDENTLRFLSHNFNSISTNNNKSSSESIKDKRFRELINRSEADILATQEDNKDWTAMAVNQRPQEKCRGWFRQHKVQTAHNTHPEESDGTHLQGGTSVYAINEVVNRVKGSGVDPSGLGRWCHIRLKGKNNMVTRFYSAYKPCRNTKGNQSVHAQHERVLLANKDTRTPQKAFLEDFQRDIQVAITAGDQIVIGADLNMDLNKHDLDEFYNDLQLHEIILHHHGPGGPRTYLRGSTKVDGLIMSRTLHCTACGYLAPDASIGDHLITWADITYASSLGHVDPIFPTKNARKLQLEDPRVVDRYIARLKSEVKKSRLQIRAENIYLDAVDKPTEVDPDLFDAILWDLLKCMDVAEKHCRSFKTGAVEWSAELGKHIFTVQFWSMVVCRKQGKRIDSRYLHFLSTYRMDDVTTHINNISLERAHRILRAVKRQYRKEAKRDEELRRTHLENLAIAKALANNTKEASESKNLLQREAAAKMQKAIKMTKAPKKSQSCKELEAPALDDPDSEWVTHTSRSAVEEAGLQFLDKHFRQAYDTPPLQEPFVSEFGFLADTPAAAQVLDGTYVPPDNMDPYLVDLLRHCKRPGSVTDLSAIMTMKEYQGIWRKGAKEKTSSCPKSPHFGHYIAMASDNSLSQLMAHLLSVPMLAGFSPELYRLMTACLLQKKPGVIQIDKQRFILLLDGMFSTSCRFMARKTAVNAEKFHLLAKEQFGSRKVHDAMQLSINLKISMDLTIQLRRPQSIVCNDLTSCYDRMIHSITSLRLQQVGHSLGPIKCRFSTTQNLVVNMRTAFGDSELTNATGTWLVPIGRPINSALQGSPDGPINWALVSTPVLEVMRELGYGVAFKCALSGEKLDLVGCMFVDDATYFQTAVSDLGEDVIDRTQAAQSYLRGLLWATGGALNPTKSFWWMIDFEWKSGIWTFKKKAKLPGALNIRDKNGDLVSLQRYEHNEAQRVLGVHAAPSDKGKGQVKALRQKAEDWAAYATTRKINPTYAWIGLMTGIMKGLEWPLPATTLSRKQCKYIMAPLLKVGLRASGVQWKLNRIILYGSPSVLGLGFPSIYTTAGIRKILHLINHAHKKTMTGALLRATVEQLKLEIGLPGNLFQWKHADWKEITTMTWISSVWKFATESGILVLPTTPDLKSRRVHDQFIMQIFGAAGISGKELRPLQRCRLFLQATTLTDLANAEGTHLTTEALQGIRRQMEPAYYNWPIQKNPSRSDWQAWRRTLAPVLRQGLGEAGRKLLQPLGQWNDNERDKWIWFYVANERRLYQRTNNGWKFYIHAGHANRPLSGRYIHPEITDELPAHATRAKVQRTRGLDIRLLGHGEDAPAPIIPPPPTSFLNLLTTLTPLHRFLLERIRGCTEAAVTCIADSITQGTARIVSDGSYFDSSKVAAFQVRIEDGLKQHQLIVTQYVPGPLEANDAYRAEAAGILTGFLLLQNICKYCELTTGSIKVGCDGQSALNKSTQEDWDVRISDKHHDILSCSHQIRNDLPITLLPIWVKGHADDEGIPYCRMDRLTQLNVDCDRGAKALARILPTQPPLPVTSNLWSISIRGTPVINDMEDTMRKAIHDPKLLEYWNWNERLLATQHTVVDWDSLKHATDNASHRRKLFVTKAISENCPTANNMQKWGYRDKDFCPRCNEWGECFRHVLHCFHPTSAQRWAKSIDTLDTWLISVKTEPTMRKALVAHLRLWHSDEHLYYIPFTLRKAFDEQDKIGWDTFLFGFVSLEWQKLQNEHYASMGSLRTGKRWVSALIRKLWEVAWDQWDHRNSQLHGEQKLDEYTDTDDLDLEVRHEYATGRPPNCPARFRRYFRYDSVDEVLALSNLERRLWVRSVKTIRDAITNLDGLAAERAAMHAWLAQYQPLNQQPAP